MSLKVKKTYHIITIGCQMNKSDSERFAGYLESLGFSLSLNQKEADLVIINTCGVRQSAEDRVYGLVPKIKRNNSEVKIILTGCLSARKDVQRRLEGKIDLWLSIIDLPKLNKKLKTLFPDLKFKQPIELDQGKDYLKIIPKKNSSFSVFVPIGNGCDNFCTYCVVPYARGREKYRPAEDIINEVRGLVQQGVKEIILIAQNVNSYISPEAEITPVDFTKLIQAIDKIKGYFWIRFATNHPKDMKQKLISTIAISNKICHHIHLPAQSGDNEVLTKMNRNYTIKHYKKIINQIRDKIPDISITTDIIVGFPGETRKNFENTVKLFEEVKFDMAYIAKYSPRPGTVAFKIKDDVSPKEKKNREEALMKILRQTALRNNKKYLNQKVIALIEGQDRQGNWFGRTDTNKNIRIKKSLSDCSNVLGSFQEVKIKKINDFGLSGEIIKPLN